MWPKKPISENSSKQSPGDGTTSNASSKALHDTHGPRLTIYIEGYNGGRESREKCAVVRYIRRLVELGLKAKKS